MSKNTIVDALVQIKVQTGSLACLGCRYEDRCSLLGCAIIRAALDHYTPKSVRYEYDGFYDGKPVYDRAYCMQCDYEFEADDSVWGCDYCPNCGQALGWEALTMGNKSEVKNNVLNLEDGSTETISRGHPGSWCSWWDKPLECVSEHEQEQCGEYGWNCESCIYFCDV